MRFLMITLAAVAAALGTYFGLQRLNPIDTSNQAATDERVTVEQILDRPLDPAPLPSGRLLMGVDETVVDVTPPEPDQLSEDMDAPAPTEESTPSDESDTLTDDAERLAELSEEDTGDTSPQTDADTDTGTESQAEAGAEGEAGMAANDDGDASDATPTPSQTPTPSASPTAAPTPSKTPAPTATAKPKPSPSATAAPSPTPTPDRAAAATTEAPGGGSTLSTGTPLADNAIAPSSHDIDARSKPRTPAPTAAPQATRRAASTAAPAPQVAEDDPEAWWLRPTTPEQLGIVHVGTASFNRAIVLMTDGGFDSVRSVSRNVEVIRGGIVLDGEWTISPANDHLLIFKLEQSGEYAITVGAGLQDRKGRLWPHTVRGTLYVP